MAVAALGWAAVGFNKLPVSGDSPARASIRTTGRTKQRAQSCVYERPSVSGLPTRLFISPLGQKGKEGDYENFALDVQLGRRGGNSCLRKHGNGVSGSPYSGSRTGRTDHGPARGRCGPRKLCSGTQSAKFRRDPWFAAAPRTSQLHCGNQASKRRNSLLGANTAEHRCCGYLRNQRELRSSSD